ncbi:MAG: GspH/FimT family pseudopilin [Rugosibacter sp.]|nr:GspH/FimT family pseudopilin [Rugosibacter sp.]
MVSHRRRACGFSLIEVMVVIAILGIAMGIGVPGLQSLLANQKMKSATFDLVTTAMVARSEAIKWSGASSASISIVAPASGFGGGWCVTFTSTTPCDMSSPNDGVIQVVRSTQGVDYIYLGAPPGTSAIPLAPIIFNRSGRLASGSSVRLQVNDSNATANSRCISIDSNGNATVKSGACT